MRRTILLIALLTLAFAQDLCQTCNQPRQVLQGKPAILDQVIESNGVLSLFYYTFKGYVFERCLNIECSSTAAPLSALPGQFDGSKPFTASILGNQIVAATAQSANNNDWTVSVALNGQVVSNIPVRGQITDMDLVGTPSSPAFLGITGKNNGKNFNLVYTVGTTGITGPAVVETPSATNSRNVIVGAIGPNLQASFAVASDLQTVGLVSCLNPTCTSVRYVPVGNFNGLLAQQGVSLTFRGQNPVLFVAAANQPLRTVFCNDALCATPTVTATKYQAFPQTINIAPDSTIVLASVENNAGRVSIIKCQDASCSSDSVPVIVNGVDNPLVSVLYIGSGVQILLKTVQRALLINLCGPFPQQVQPAEVDVTQGAQISVKGTGFCPQDNIIRLDDFPFQATVVSGGEARVTLGPNVLPGTYQVGLQNANGQRFGVVLSSDLRVRNGCPFNCSGHGYCNGLTDRCVCDNGFSGADCSQAAGSPCPNGCGGNGICNTQTGQCTCLQGFSGPDCGTAGRTCPNNCSNHGKCNSQTGECKCSFFHCGADCSKRWPLCR